MSHRQLQEIRLRDFRCFRGRQTVPLAPLTLLVGENSTGKTSLLAAVRAICDVAFRQREPDFREPPYDLGAFPEIVHTRSDRQSKPESFEVSIKALGLATDVLRCCATFKSGTAAAPRITAGLVTRRDIWIKWQAEGSDAFRFEFGSDGESWGEGESQSRNTANWVSLALHSYLATPSPRVQDDSPLWRNLPDGITNILSIEQHQTLTSLTSEFQNYLTGSRPFASAPTHPSPRRTYDPMKLSDDPWGADVPSLFASLQFQGDTEWTALKERLDAFGRESGLFDDLSVKQLTKGMGAPFQLQVRKFSKRGTKGPRRNLVDVGFGISQVLPVLAALLRADGPPMFLLQQPELHLHPSAQAALGSLFCRTAESGRQLIVETHSDYILDRILLDIRDRRTKLKPEDVSLLYFERKDQDVAIHLIGIDKEGSVSNAPEGYRRFFKDELKRVLDY